MIQVDGALYPDQDPPDTLETLETRIDFIARLCSAWDFGLLPDLEVVKELRKPEWREAIDVYQLLTSPTYHLLREWQGLPPFLSWAALRRISWKTPTWTTCDDLNLGTEPKFRFCNLS